MNQIKACCGNCGLWLEQPNTDRGVCLRYPPVVVAMPQEKRDLAMAAVAVQWVPTAVRPSTGRNEVCGEIRPKVQTQNVQ